MKKATRFMYDRVSTEGGFVWNYTADLSRRWGELEAYPTMVWVEKGTPEVGQLMIDAYHATGDEFYYDMAVRSARILIRGQLPAGAGTTSSTWPERPPNGGGSRPSAATPGAWASTVTTTATPRSTTM